MPRFSAWPRAKDNSSLLSRGGRTCAPPSLAKLCVDGVIHLVCTSLRRVLDCIDPLKVVRSKDWIEAKALIHVSLSDKCIEEIYSKVFTQDFVVPTDVVTHSGLSRPELLEIKPKKTLNTSKILVQYSR